MYVCVVHVCVSTYKYVCEWADVMACICTGRFIIFSGPLADDLDIIVVTVDTQSSHIYTKQKVDLIGTKNCVVL